MDRQNILDQYIPQVSIIVPIYNVDRYLRRCIDSIIGQTFKNWELILVDDGSTDSSGLICDDYSFDERVIVIHKKNEGISITRQFGLNKAKGRYIQFVDSDDWIESTMIEKMYDLAITNNADLVSCDFVQENYYNSTIINIPFDNIYEYRKLCVSSFWTVLWRNLICRRLIIDNSICFPHGIDGGEDYQFITMCALRANIVSYCPEALYHYNCINQTSFMRTPTFEKLYFQVTTTKYIENELGGNNLYQKELMQRKFQVSKPFVTNHFWKSIHIFPEVDKYVYNEKWHIHGLRWQLLLRIKYTIKYILNKIL